MAQDRRGNALVYFCGAVDDLFGAVLHRHLDLEFVDMTREDIIRMAREANVYCTTRQPTLDAMLERFAALVAAAEREACAKLCDDHWNKSIDCGDKAGALQCVGIRTAIRAREQA